MGDFGSRCFEDGDSSVGPRTPKPMRRQRERMCKGMFRTRSMSVTQDGEDLQGSSRDEPRKQLLPDDLRI